MIKKIQAVILTVILALSAAAVTAQPAFATEKKPFTLEVKSNFFPSKTVSYADVNRYADQNGDIYLTVDFNIFEAAVLVHRDAAVIQQVAVHDSVQRAVGKQEFDMLLQ